MELSYLRIEDFRNLGAVEFEPGPKFNIFSGANGQGKTNLLEAVYLLSAVKSFRPQRNNELIRWGHKRACIEGRIDRAGVDRIARIEISSKGKNVTLNGTTVKKLSSFFGSLNAIVFSPDDLAILKGGPDERRRFIDRAIFNVSVSYLTDIMSYQAVLKRRNALLRTGQNTRTLLEVYDDQLAALGATIARRRLEYLAKFAPLFKETFEAIFAGAHNPDQDPEALPPAIPDVSLAYQAAWMGGTVDVSKPVDQADLEAKLREGLSTAHTEDLRRGYTTRGPHRDDLRTALAGHPVKAYASQGQQRAVVLSMKIAEVRLFQETRGFRPILLLDDVSSELDRTRNRFLFEFLKQHPGQVFITTTHRDHILLDEQVTAFTVSDGQLQKAD